MRLVDLNPRFMRGGGEGISYAPTGEPVPPYTAGVDFDCPCGKCGKRCYVPFKNPPEQNIPGHPSEDGWQRTGTTFDDLTLAPSIFRNPARGGCGWHGFIENGGIRNV